MEEVFNALDVEIQASVPAEEELEEKAAEEPEWLKKIDRSEKYNILILDCLSSISPESKSPNLKVLFFEGVSIESVSVCDYSDDIYLDFSIPYCKYGYDSGTSIIQTRICDLDVPNANFGRDFLVSKTLNESEMREILFSNLLDEAKKKVCYFESQISEEKKLQEFYQERMISK